MLLIPNYLLHWYIAKLENVKLCVFVGCYQNGNGTSQVFFLLIIRWKKLQLCQSHNTRKENIAFSPIRSQTRFSRRVKRSPLLPFDRYYILWRSNTHGFLALKQKTRVHIRGPVKFLPWLELVSGFLALKQKTRVHIRGPVNIIILFNGEVILFLVLFVCISYKWQGPNLEQCR